MNQRTLLQAIDHPSEHTRLQVVQVIHLVAETAALGALIRRYQVETVPTIKEAIAGAGRCLRELSDNGYNTLDAIFSFFRVDDEIAYTSNADEAQLIRQVQENAALQLMKEKQAAQHRRMLGNAAFLAGAAAIGGVSGAMMASNTLMSNIGSDVLSSNITGGEAAATHMRIPPMAPTDADIRSRLTRLADAPDPAKRRSAAVDLGDLNNPAALPALAHAFLSDPAREVRTIAQRAGKLIYWNGIYWQMTQDGTFEKEYTRRRALVEKRRKTGELSATPPPVPSSPAESQEDIAAILRRAEERRRKRGQK